MVGAEERGARPNSDRDGGIYCLVVPVLNLVISRRSCAGTGKKCTKKRDASAIVVLLIKPIAFLTFSLPSPS